MSGRLHQRFSTCVTIGKRIGGTQRKPPFIKEKRNGSLFTINSIWFVF